MSKHESNTTNSTTNETQDPLLKSRVLIALKNACHNIHLPNSTDFKIMIEHKDTVLCGNIPLSSLYHDWPEFYILENSIAAAIATFSGNAEHLYLNVMALEYKEVLRQFEQLKKW